MGLVLPAPIFRTEGVWALPVVTGLVPSERLEARRRRRHGALVDVWRMVRRKRRRLPGRDLVPVAAGGFSGPAFLHATRRGGVAAITHPAPDAALHARIATPTGHDRPPSQDGRAFTRRDLLAARGASWRSVWVVG